MAFYFVGDGTVDVAVSIEPSEYHWLSFFADSFSENEHLGPPVGAGLSASLMPAPSALTDVLCDLYQQELTWTEGYEAPGWSQLDDAPSGSISGTASITFSQSGTITATGGLAGTTSIAFAQSGTLTGIASLSSNATVTFGQSGILTATGSLSGSTSITFSQSGNLTGASLGSISGTASITFSQSGFLTASGYISGSASITFGQSGSILDANAADPQPPPDIVAGPYRPGPVKYTPAQISAITAAAKIDQGTIQ